MVPRADQRAGDDAALRAFGGHAGAAEDQELAVIDEAVENQGGGGKGGVRREDGAGQRQRLDVVDVERGALRHREVA